MHLVIERRALRGAACARRCANQSAHRTGPGDDQVVRRVEESTPCQLLRGRAGEWFVASQRHTMATRNAPECLLE